MGLWENGRRHEDLMPRKRENVVTSRLRWERVCVSERRTAGRAEFGLGGPKKRKKELTQGKKAKRKKKLGRKKS